MKRILQVIFALAHFAVAAFCAFGFLASFEPVENAMVWRVGYTIAFIAALAGGIWWIRKRSFDRSVTLHPKELRMSSEQQWVVKYKLPGDQVRTPREIIVTAISQSDAIKVAQAMIPSAIILGGPQVAR